jgi:Lon protease-like protein
MSDEPSLEHVTRPLTEEELGELPVFPLPRVVFFPGTVLPLHIFEPRYRAMVEACLRSGPRAMAVTLLRPGWEAAHPGRPPIHRVAGVGRFLEVNRRRDGRFDLLLLGLGRVELEELPAEGLPYRRAKATPLAERAPNGAAVERLVEEVMSSAAAISALVRRKHPDFELGLDPQLPPGILADRIADRLVADVERRQALLEEQDVKVRLSVLGDSLLELLSSLAPRTGLLH